MAIGDILVRRNTESGIWKDDIITPTVSDETVVSLSSNVQNSTTTLADVTELSFNLDANSLYVIEGWIVFDTSATTVGIKLSAKGPTSPTVFSGHFITNNANGTPDSSSFNANDVTVATSASSFTSGNLAAMHAVVKTGSNSGTFQLRFAAETTGTITIRAGSVLKMKKIK
jgi:hypothetical protein